MEHPDKYRRLARRAWEQANRRKIPEGHHVHHVDRDVTNNDPANLQLMTPSEHALHHRATEPSRWSACQQCGAGFVLPWPYTPQRFCSNRCKSAHRRASGVDDILKSCVRCGTLFLNSRYSKQKFCSRVCTSPGKYARKVADFFCVECGTRFVARDRRAMYCTEACRKRHYRRAFTAAP